MIRRTVITLASIAVVALLYMVSKTFLGDVNVPIVVNPGIQTGGGSSGSDADRQSSDVLMRVAPEISSLFPDENDWRRVSANVITTTDRNVFFLFKGRPAFSKDGKTLSLGACTVVFLPQKKKDEEQSPEDAVKGAFVFESTDQLDLFFTRSLSNFFNLNSSDITLSAFDSGRMRGAVIIRSELDADNPEDDLWLQTRDVVFNGRQIRTSLEVSFQFGRNRGAGKGLTLDMDLPFGKKTKVRNADVDKMTAAERIDAMVGEGNLGGGFSLHKIEINELPDFFRLYYNSFSQFGAEQKKDAAPRAGEEDDSLDDYIDVRCRDGLYFSSNSHEIGGWCARFNRDVELVSYRGGEKSEQLRCDSLYLYFQDADLDALASSSPEARVEIKRKKPTGRLARLKPTVVRAVSTGGSPVSVKLNEQDVEITASEIQYSLITRTLDLVAEDQDSPVRIVRTDRASHDRDKPLLQFSSSQIKAELTEKNELRQVFAASNGALTVQLQNGDAAPRMLSAYWNNGLKAAPETAMSGTLVVALSGDVTFNLEDFGSFMANEANFWCKFFEKPTAPSEEQALRRTPENPAYAQNATPSDDVVPVGAKENPAATGFALKNYESVMPVCAKFVGDVSFNAPIGTASIRESVTVRFDRAPEGQTAAPADATSATDSTRARDALLGDSPKERFTISGGRLNIWCLLDERRDDAGHKKSSIELYRLLLQDAASFRAHDTETDVDTLSLDADFAQIDNPNAPTAKITLRSENRPTSFRVKELELNGREVVVDREANSFAVEGGGEIIIDQPLSTAGKNVGNADLSNFFTDDPVRIAWSDSMTFDGRTLSFTGTRDQAVTIAQNEQSLICAKANVILKNQVELFNLNLKDSKTFEAECVQCFGGGPRGVVASLVEYETDATGTRKIASRYKAFLNDFTFLRSTGRFLSEQGGELWATIRSDSLAGQGGLGETGALLAGAGGGSNQNNAEKDAGKEKKDGWTLLRARFSGTLEGLVARRSIEAKKRVQIDVRNLESPDQQVNMDDPNASGAVRVTCERMIIQVDQEASAIGKTAPSFEVEGRENVEFRYETYYGICDVIRYSSKKERVVLSSSDSAKGKFVRKIAPGAPGESLGEFTRCQISLNPLRYDLEGAAYR